MKKIFLCTLSALLLLLALTACGEGEGAVSATPSDSPTPTQSQEPSPSATPEPPPTVTPTPSPTPTPTPTPPPTPAPTPSPTPELESGDTLPFDEDFVLKLSFSGGVGAWWTSLELYNDGLFNGQYNDFSYGEVGEGYPEGTKYIGNFGGRFGKIQRLDDYMYYMELEELFEEPEGIERIEDGVRYVTARPLGIEGGGIFYFYTPDFPTAKLPYKYEQWYFSFYGEMPGDTLGCYGLYNVTTDTWFFS